jgi:hypothetical protein
MVLAEGLARYEARVTEPVTRVETSWAGLRTFAPDRCLVLGPDPLDPAFVWCAGQGGYGFQTSPAASALLAARVAGTRARPAARRSSRRSPPTGFRPTADAAAAPRFFWRQILRGGARGGAEAPSPARDRLRRIPAGSSRGPPRDSPAAMLLGPARELGEHLPDPRRTGAGTTSSDSSVMWKLSTGSPFAAKTSWASKTRFQKVISPRARSTKAASDVPAISRAGISAAAVSGRSASR